MSTRRPFPGDSRPERLARARQHMPMGVAENYRYWGDDETIFIDTMKGGTITDFDGNTYVDFRLGYGPIILGYRDDRVDDAVVRTIKQRGTVCGFSSDIEVEVIELVKRMCPQISKMRFANSGTEAVMGAVRVARGFTGRDHIIQIEGGFHGLYDEMMWKSDLDGWDASAGTEPAIVPFGTGIPGRTRDLSRFVPLNDGPALEKAFAACAGDVAAVVIESIQGNAGSIASTDEYMAQMRALCDAHGALLIVDEVKTGFRVAPGGAQELYGVYADLTTFAKAMGNGYPVAAFGGRADVMDAITGTGGVVHGGTYTANLIGLSAARATLDVLANTDALKTIDRVGAQIRGVLGEVFDHFDLQHRFAGPAAMFGVHLGPTVPRNYRDWKATQSALYAEFAKNCIRGGIMLEPDSREPWFICEAHAAVDLDWLRGVATTAMKDALATHGSAG